MGAHLSDDALTMAWSVALAALHLERVREVRPSVHPYSGKVIPKGDAGSTNRSSTDIASRSSRAPAP